MKGELDKLKAILKKSLEVTLKNTDPENIDLILDNRDEAEFSDAWIHAYNLIEKEVIDPEIKSKIDEFRKEIFVLTFRNTGSSDLPAYISDDVDLICSYYVLDIHSTWVSHLLFTYLNYQIPQGILMETDQTINELIQ
ncbi:hypothetical protein [Chryseobacterium vrystaatense]|uniref:Uncharacterized protein n=1 Tax=Chryseobacterium vrystaatense TaxID=307480 RepID=A0A1M5PEB3_9FLAO|nr:hypothetical protein [Chryseobacterium vrystaatense]SHG99593.1 hypothetical protein SAMN02787073_0049 [Chryseobacterium vrystaatense]